MNVPREVVARLSHDVGLTCSSIVSPEDFVQSREAFANAIAKWQREKDAEICFELSLAGGGGKATTPGGACLECADSILNQGEHE